MEIITESYIIKLKYLKSEDEIKDEFVECLIYDRPERLQNIESY
jgi:hypothetical protein